MVTLDPNSIVVGVLIGVLVTTIIGFNKWFWNWVKGCLAGSKKKNEERMRFNNEFQHFLKKMQNLQSNHPGSADLFDYEISLFNASSEITTSEFAKKLKEISPYLKPSPKKIAGDTISVVMDKINQSNVEGELVDCDVLADFIEGQCEEAIKKNKIQPPSR